MTKLEQKLIELGYSQVLFDLPMYNQYKEKGFYIVIELDDKKKKIKKHYIDNSNNDFNEYEDHYEYICFESIEDLNFVKELLEQLEKDVEVLKYVES